MRSLLISALIGCTDRTRRSRSRRFLEGLSSDELQFIAEYLGSCILESTYSCGCSRAELARRVAQFEAARGNPTRQQERQEADSGHKMILLLEFLCRGGMQLSATPDGYRIARNGLAG
ncbi:MAG TPA: hypothetical protein VHW24_18930 [Bryobacteraceae bacterium]|nr:hypothetical protein [Bryobacteraceae bacterium]